MLQHWNRQFLVGTNDILKKNPTLKSSLCKVCEFKYAFLKRERDRERETTSDPSTWFVAKGIKKKK